MLFERKFGSKWRSFMKKSVFIFILLLPLLGRSDELDHIRKVIEETGAKWKAGRTCISDLGPEERRLLCGLNLPESLHTDVSLPLAVFDSVWDWRNHNGHNWMTPIRDQGPCGSCWAFGALGVLEPMIKIFWNDPDFSVDLSEQYLVSCSNGSCNGYTLSGTANFLMTDGTTDEDCFPYQASDLPCEDRCSDWEARLRKIESWEWVSSDSVKFSLMAGPLYTGMIVYPSFFYYTGGVYESLPGEEPVGGHAVVICGWNDADSCWICKNSWGTGWGEEGWFRIKWGDSELGYDNIAMTPVSGLVYFSSELDDSLYGDGDGVFNPNEEIILTVTLQNIGDTLKSVTGVLSSSDSFVVITDSVGFYGDISPLSLASNLLDPFQLKAAELGQVPLSLNLTGSEKIQYTKQLNFFLATSLAQANWPLHLLYSVFSSPAIVDLDGNGTEELIVGCNDGNLYVMEVDGSHKAGFPFSTGEEIIGSPAVGDVTGDGELEVVVCTKLGSVYLLSDSGEVITQTTTPDLIYATPVLSDLNGDGRLEIIIGCMNGKLYVFNHDGSDYPNFPFSVRGKISAGAAVADLNADGIKDIVVGTANDTVYAISSNGTLLWKFPTGYWVRSAPSIADIDGLKVVVGSWDKNLYILNPDGTEYAKVATGEKIKTSPSFADLDQDGDLEIVFSSGKETFVCNSDGTILVGWPKEAESSIQSSACFADMDGDGLGEIIFGSDDGSLYAYKPDGSLMPYFPIPTHAKIFSSPAVSDLDEDGDIEIVFGNDNGIHVIDYKSNAGTNHYWNMYRGNPERTGYYGDLVAMKERPTEAKYRIYLYQNYPNPFYSTTVIPYQLSRPARVDLSIYNIMGQKIKTLTKGKREAGVYREYWDRRDERGNRVSAGIYFYRLQTENFSLIRKMVLLKK